MEAAKQLPGTRPATPHLLNHSHHPMSNWGAACQARPSKPYIPPPWASSAQARKAKLFPTHQTDQARVPRREHCPGWVCKKTGLLVLPRLNSAPQSQPYTPNIAEGGKKNKSTAKLSQLSPTGVAAENLECFLPALPRLAASTPCQGERLGVSSEVCKGHEPPGFLRASPHSFDLTQAHPKT